MNIFDKVEHYYNGLKIVKDWVGSGGIVVGQEQSQKRADVCLNCEKNTDGIAFEKEAAEAIKKIIELKNHLKLHVNGEKKLKACAACLCNLPTKVHTPLEYIMRHTNIEEVKTYPEKCWVRTEQNL